MVATKIPSTYQEDILKFLVKLEEKLEAPALNGGFDLLFQKVDNIEKNVDKLNEAVFNPQTGLFVRVQSEKVETAHDVEDIVKRVSETEEKLKLYRKFVIGGILSIVTMLAKVLWDAVTSHVTFH